MGGGESNAGGSRAAKPPPRRGDGKGVLGLLAAGVHAPVAKNAAGQVADIEIVVYLYRLRDGGGSWQVLASVSFGASAVAIHILLGSGRERKVHRGGKELHHHAPGQANPLRIGPHHHPALDLA